MPNSIQRIVARFETFVLGRGNDITCTAYYPFFFMYTIITAHLVNSGSKYLQLFPTFSNSKFMNPKFSNNTMLGYRFLYMKACFYFDTPTQFIRQNFRIIFEYFLFNWSGDVFVQKANIYTFAEKIYGKTYKLINSVLLMPNKSILTFSLFTQCNVNCQFALRI